jgi:hypothetical protein
VGIGGGGDVAGAIAVGALLRARGVASRVGGVSWERRPIDPLPGPRRLAEVRGVRPLHRAAGLVGPDATGPGGFRFAEAHAAGVLGEPTVLVDPHDGPSAVGEGLLAAARALACDLVVLIDVGGDVLGHGDEPGLASPLCDAVLLAAAPVVAAGGLPVVGAVFCPGGDGELTPAEVMARVAEVARAGGLLGGWLLTPEAAGALRAAVARIPTEASAQALRAFAGELGDRAIRDGQRTVAVSPLGALTVFFDPAAAMASAARLAAAVADCPSLAAAEARLAALGVRTELAAERGG